MTAGSPGEEILYTVRRSTRARRVRVSVHAHTGVEVVLPQRAPERAAAAAVSELRPWIEGRLDEAREALALIAARAGTVPYLGRALQLVPQQGRSRVHRDGERLLVPEGDARGALERYYRRAARRGARALLARASARPATRSVVNASPARARRQERAPRGGRGCVRRSCSSRCGRGCAPSRSRARARRRCGRCCSRARRAPRPHARGR